MIVSLSAIIPLSAVKTKTCFLQPDANSRTINIFTLNNSQLVGENLFYPNVLLYAKDKIYNPLEESVMSLDGVKAVRPLKIKQKKIEFIEKNPVFYFIYNTDNYYHFVYDTLPYLISFFYLKRQIKPLKLLVNLPGPHRNTLYKFVEEFFQLLGISSKDLIFCNNKTLYKTIFISNSFTHGKNSNLPPRSEIFTLYKKIISNAKKIAICKRRARIYISRRTWLHNNFDNIGTNYTQRRKLINEDELVRQLAIKNFVEVFSENLSVAEKVLLFNKAEIIAGAIGGGMVNAVFAKKNAKIMVFVSPTFFEKNNRFKFCFLGKKVLYNNNSMHVEKTFFKKYMRVQVPSRNIIGEIVEVEKKTLRIAYVTRNVTGWNTKERVKYITIKQKNCIRLDSGLNSAWKINLPL